MYWVGTLKMSDKKELNRDNTQSKEKTLMPPVLCVARPPGYLVRRTIIPYVSVNEKKRKTETGENTK
jgi:hypothetical protein